MKVSSSLGTCTASVGYETSDNLRGIASSFDVNIVTTKQHMFTTQHASYDFIAKTSADGAFEVV